MKIWLINVCFMYLYIIYIERERDLMEYIFRCVIYWNCFCKLYILKVGKVVFNKLIN